MTYTYFEHEIACTLNEGTAYENKYTVKRCTLDGNYKTQNLKGNKTEVTKTTKITTDKQFVQLDDWSVLLWGKMYITSEEHTGTYVIHKDVWEDYATKYNYDDSLLNVVTTFDWEENDWLENDGNEYVVFDLGGQLETIDEDGYYRAIDEDELPQLPLANASWDYSNVGNG